MKVLVLGPHPYYIDRGTPIDLDLLLQALSRAGYRADAVVYAAGEDRQYPGIEVHRVGSRRWLAGIRPGFSVPKVLADVLMFVRAWKLVRTRSYDVVHAGEEAVFMAMFYKAVHGVPYIYDMDSSVAQQMVERFPWLGPLRGLFSRLEARAVAGSVAVAPVCNALADLAREGGASLVVTLHDISRMSPKDFRSDGSLRRELGLEGQILMYVGNLEPYQGMDLLLEALSEVVRPDGVIALDLVVAGGSPGAIRAYGEKAKALGIQDRVHFIGPWPAARLGSLLAEADILTAPRIKGINTPMKVFPYLHSGKPVLVTALPTHTQILTERVAELAPPDPKGFADAILRLAGDEGRRRRLGEAGRRFVEENHTIDAHQARVESLYGQVRSSLGTAGERGT